MCITLDCSISDVSVKDSAVASDTPYIVRKADKEKDIVQISVS